MSSRKIVIADGIPLFRDGLRRLVLRYVTDAFVLEADDFDSMLRVASENHPALIVLDLLLCGHEYCAAISRLRQHCPDSAILVIAADTQKAQIKAIIEHGADGCVARSVKPEVMVEVLTATLGDEPVGRVELSELSPRQRQILEQLALGRTNKEIALALGISHYTVRVHISSLFRLLGVNSRTAAVAAASGLRL